MFGQMRTSALGMRAGQMMLDVTAHNISNVNTTGYRSGRANFVDLAHAAVTEMDTGAGWRSAHLSGVESAPVDVDRGHGVRGGDTAWSQRSGALMQTGVPTDLAVEGPGYLPLVAVSGRAAGYTRDGSLRMDAEGHLIHNSGAFLADGEGDAVRLARDEGIVDLEVNSRGAVSSVDADGQSEQLARLSLLVPENGQRLVSGGANTYHLVDENGRFVGGTLRYPGEDAGLIRQGFLEGSNADLAREMSRMIMAQRAFQINGRSLQTVDEMFEKANHLGG
ncbi:MAG: flagellar hook-basal body protein [Bacillota bacterium]